MMLLALTLSFSAFTALSLAMEKHQHDLHGKAAAPRHGARSGGYWAGHCWR